MSSAPSVRTAMEQIPLDERSVLARAARVLDAFDAGGGWLGLGDLTAHTGLPKSTVHRLADQLVALGWLERGHLGYRIGIRLFEIGRRAGRHRHLRTTARPRLQTLSVQSQLAVYLGVLDGSEVLVLELVPTRDFLPPVQEGGREPAHSTALGRVLAAFGTREDVDCILDGPMPARPGVPVPTAPALFEELARIRVTGFAVDVAGTYPGVAGIAVPLRGAGRAVAGIAVLGRAEHIRVETHLPQLVCAATGIWADMFQGTRPSAPVKEGYA